MPDDSTTEEQDETTSVDDNADSGGVDIREQFQRSASALLDGASKSELGWLATKASEMRYEMECEERDEKEGPTMTTEGMPS